MDVKAIRHLRQELGLSQSALAARAGVSQGYLSQLETGQEDGPSLRVLADLAEGLDLPFCAVLAHLGFECGCRTDWGPLARHPVMRAFGRLPERRAELVVALMRELAAPPARSRTSLPVGDAQSVRRG